MFLIILPLLLHLSLLQFVAFSHSVANSVVVDQIVVYLYRNRPIGVLETFFLHELNFLAFATFTWYS